MASSKIYEYPWISKNKVYKPSNAFAHGKKYLARVTDGIFHSFSQLPMTYFASAGTARRKASSWWDVMSQWANAHVHWQINCFLWKQETNRAKYDTFLQWSSVQCTYKAMSGDVPGVRRRLLWQVSARPTCGRKGEPSFPARASSSTQLGMLNPGHWR